MNSYHLLFQRLQQRQQGAFIPFVTLGDPNPELSLTIIDTLVRAGADGLELGLPFSDPVADGATIQAANIRALASGTTRQQALAIVQTIRARYPDLPIGLLVYANITLTPNLDAFYQQCAVAGVDSVLIADVPVRSAQPFIVAAQRASIAPVLIAPPDASTATLTDIARCSEGYVYLLSRAGVTGAEQAMAAPTAQTIAQLQAVRSAPPLLGFGISTPTQVKSALAAGAAGVIVGSAVVDLIAAHYHDQQLLVAELTHFVQTMKQATNNHVMPLPLTQI